MRSLNSNPGYSWKAAFWKQIIFCSVFIKIVTRYFPRLVQAHQNQRQVQITDPFKQTMESRLIRQRARQDGFSITHHRDSQTLAPFRPMLGELFLYADSVMIHMWSWVLPFLNYSDKLIILR